jgi:chemotaxis-related protein WspB
MRQTQDNRTTMLLRFVIGEDSYGVDVAQVVEIVPYVALKRIPRAPDYVAGLLNFRGSSVPVIDVTKLASGRASRTWLSTRVIVVKSKQPQLDGTANLLGLLAEQVTRTVKIPEQAFASAGLERFEAEHSSCLGDVAVTQKGIIQRIEVEQLLSAQTRAELFKTHSVAGQ